jgi:hypothetical protein
LALDAGEWSSPQAFYPWYSLARRLGGPQSRSGCYREEKNRPSAVPSIEHR